MRESAFAERFNGLWKALAAAPLYKVSEQLLALDLGLSEVQHPPQSLVILAPLMPPGE